MATIRGFSLAKIAKIHIKFSAFDTRVASARELLRRVSASPLKQTNPKCEVTSNITGDMSEPTADVTFSDGSSLHFKTSEVKALHMVAQINRKTRTL